jgi:hypothetical protein
MTAHLYCWAPDLDLTPSEADFHERVDALHRGPKPPRSPRLVRFVDELLTRYPDLMETENTVWGDGPLVGNILGDFINMSLIWSGYVEAAQFVIETAHKHGLHCYDPQTSTFYPASTH